jgi:hypothetical protein
MRIVLKILAILLIVMGIIWILQGVNLLPGSYMSGQLAWAYRGAAAVIIGLLIWLLVNRRRKLD